MPATTATRLSPAGTTFVGFMLSYFGHKSIKAMNQWTHDYRLTAVLKQCVEVAHKGYYAEVVRSFEMAAYTLGWVIETGRVNGATVLALREMDVKTLLQLVGNIHDLGITGDAVADFLMSLALQPTCL